MASSEPFVFFEFDLYTFTYEGECDECFVDTAGEALIHFAVG